jgi:putative transposase
MQNNVIKGYHCAYQIHYHIVFPVKYRRALLYGDVKKIIEITTSEIGQRYAIEFETLGMDCDHIHIVCSAHPKISPGTIVRIYKSITARQIFKQKPEIKRELWGGEFWTDGYYVATIGERANWQIVVAYVKKQGNKEQQTSLEQLRLL